MYSQCSHLKDTDGAPSMKKYISTLFHLTNSHSLVFDLNTGKVIHNQSMKRNLKILRAIQLIESKLMDIVVILEVTIGYESG